MKVSDYIVQFFYERDIKVIFGYIGGMITHLVDSIDCHPGVKFVQTYHEQTAAIAAEGYALESGKPGVAIATSGPGATNLMTGIADAYFGNVPTIFITGQVNTYEYKNDKPIRQQGFQETDVISIVKSITKYAVMIKDANQIRFELEKAFHIANSGRKGPVLIDLPMDISRSEIDPEKILSYTPTKEIFPSINWVEVSEVIESSKRPLILVGGGCRDCKEEINNALRSLKIPYVVSLMGKGLADENQDTFCGMIGSYGNRCANIIISQCDVLIALGSRLDTRQTGARLESFMPDGKIIHVDIDVNELNFHRLSNRIAVNCDVQLFLKELIGKKIAPSADNNWHKWILDIKNKYSQYNEVQRFVENRAPYEFLEIFNDVSESQSIITTDIGQNQMWVAQTIKLKKDQEFFTTGGLAPMGFSLPAAIGAAFASPEKTVYCFNGDGGFHMACQSLLLISQYRLNIKVIVLNNTSLGMITQFQHLYFNDRMVATTESGGYWVPSIQAIALAYHLPYFSISSTKFEDYNILKKYLSLSNCIIDFLIEGVTTVSPKLEFDKPIYNCSPYLSEEEMKSLIPKWND